MRTHTGARIHATQRDTRGHTGTHANTYGHTGHTWTHADMRGHTRKLHTGHGSDAETIFLLVEVLSDLHTDQHASARAPYVSSLRGERDLCVLHTVHGSEA